MSKKALSESELFLNSKLLEQVRIYYFNLEISKNLEDFTDLLKKDELLERIETTYETFLTDFKNNPRIKFAKLYAISPEKLPSTSNNKTLKRLIKGLYLINKNAKKQILTTSKGSIEEPWIDFFKDTIVDFLKWIPISIIAIGFIRALIMSSYLGIGIKTLFSLQDYWDYGISITSGFATAFLGFCLSFLIQFYFSLYSGFNYLVRHPNNSISNSINPPKINIYQILNIVFFLFAFMCFILPTFFPQYLEIFFAVLGISLIYYAIPIQKFLFSYIESIFIRLSIYLLIATTIISLWLIPKIVNPKYPLAHSKLDVVLNCTIPSNAFYVDSSSKYHIFTTGNTTFLIPIGDIQYISITKGKS